MLGRTNDFYVANFHVALSCPALANVRVDRGGSKQDIDLKQAIGIYRSSNKKTISVRPSLLLPGFAAARHCSAWATNAVCS